MQWEKIKKAIKVGDFLEVYTENSLHCGFYCGVVDAHIPRIVLAGSSKFIHQPKEKQCHDHTFSIDIDKLVDVWKRNIWAR